MSLQHHATLFYTSKVEAVEQLINFDRSSVDHYYLESDVLKIDEVRQLQTLSIQRPVEQHERLLLVVAHSIAHEAQHALLKILEEPVLTTKIVLVLTENSQLLPTVLSRVADGKLEEDHFESGSSEQYATWSGLGIGERLSEIASHANKKDVEWMRAVLKGATQARTTLSPSSIRQLSDAVLWSQLRGSSLKMLLEELAFSVPVVKR